MVRLTSHEDGRRVGNQPGGCRVPHPNPGESCGGLDLAEQQRGWKGAGVRGIVGYSSLSVMGNLIGSRRVGMKGRGGAQEHLTFRAFLEQHSPCACPFSPPYLCSHWLLCLQMPSCPPSQPEQSCLSLMVQSLLVIKALAQCTNHVFCFLCPGAFLSGALLTGRDCPSQH